MPKPEPATALPSAIPPGSDPGPVPGEPEPKEPRNIMVALPEESATLLRRISGLTKIPKSRLVEEIETSKELRAAVLDVLRARWLDRKSRTDHADPFASLPKKE